MASYTQMRKDNVNSSGKVRPTEMISLKTTYSYDSDDEINLNDNDESEEHWRKIRHERETFLSQQEKKKSKLNDTGTESVESTFSSTKIIDESIVMKVVQCTQSFSSGDCEHLER
ncbi:uncharacterized protein LOC135849190 [Planococcus citri]|uniref:uncharacterized protein LOC135849190 n=1 Tax=Planococcus citri TaxID=170843 RepID=UPI0031FA0DCD